MKRIGIFFGMERSFPYALVARVNQLKAGVEAEPARIGATTLEHERRYDLVLDRISQDIPYYRAALKKMALEGTVVVNNPFWWSADDKFFNNLVAGRVGVAVPKTVLLPSKEHPPDTSSASMSNLTYPLDWEAIFALVGFPAYLKPYSGGGWKNVYRVSGPEEFFRFYDQTSTHVMTLQEEIRFEDYFRCYAIGRQHVHVMRYDPRRSHFERYVRGAAPTDRKLEDRLVHDCLALVGALGYDFDTLEFAVRDGVPYAIDFLNPAPDAEPGSVGEENFNWVLETAARWLVERVKEGPDPLPKPYWQDLLGAPVPIEPAAAASPRRKRSPR